MQITTRRMQAPDLSRAMEKCVDAELSRAYSQYYLVYTIDLLSRFTTRLTELSFIPVEEMTDLTWSDWVGERTGGVLTFL